MDYENCQEKFSAVIEKSSTSCKESELNTFQTLPQDEHVGFVLDKPALLVKYAQLGI